MIRAFPRRKKKKGCFAKLCSQAAPSAQVNVLAVDFVNTETRPGI